MEGGPLVPHMAADGGETFDERPPPPREGMTTVIATVCWVVCRCVLAKTEILGAV